MGASLPAWLAIAEAGVAGAVGAKVAADWYNNDPGWAPLGGGKHAPGASTDPATAKKAATAAKQQAAADALITGSGVKPWVPKP